MASETYDYEPFGNTEHSMKQIADAIRHKGYGKDVREAIAQGIGQFDQVKGEVFRRVKAVEDDNIALNQRVDNLGADLSTEAQTRAEADKELDGKITTEAQTRAEADKELDGKITTEAQTRAEADKELDGKLTAEAQTRAEADKELDGKITAEAQTRAETDQGLEQRIARLERYIFDGQPVFVDNLFPPQKSNGSIEVADDGEVTPAKSNVVDGEVRDTPTNIFIK